MDRNEWMYARFGLDGKLWHLGAIIAVGIAGWAVLIGTTYALIDMILSY